MTKLSFVIPALNEGECIGELLEYLQARFAGAERIVVDGGSSDTTMAGALRGADAVLLGARGRAVQMNLGASVAAGQYLCFLHADTLPRFDEQALLASLEGAPWAFCRVELRSRLRALRVVAGFMNRRSALTRIATGDQMLIVERALFAETGGFANIPLMEDVEICKRLRSRAKPRVLGLTVSSSARRWERHGVLRTVLLMWRLRLEFWMGASPEHLWQRYYGPRAAQHPAAQ